MPDSSVPFKPELLLEHTGWVHALARRLVADPGQADDLAQETLLAALETPPRVTPAREVGGLRGWLAAVLRNRARTRFRRETRRARRERTPHHASSGPPTPEEVLERAELHRSLVDEVLMLREPYRTTLLLRYFEGYEPTQIAKLQDTTAATVRSQLKRGLDLLRERLDRHYGTRKRWSVAMAVLAQRADPPAPPTPVPLETDSGAWPSLSWSLPGVALGLAIVGAVLLLDIRREVAVGPSAGPESTIDEGREGSTEFASVPESPAELGIASSAGRLLASRARIQGIVTDLDGVPLPDIEVRAVSTPFAWHDRPDRVRRVFSVVLRSDERDSNRATSDAAGEFAIDLSAGQYAIVAEGALVRSRRFDPIEVHPGEVVEIVVPLEPGHALHGIVRDPQGRPVPGAEVAATPGGIATGEGLMVTLELRAVVLQGERPAARVTTDRKGRFVLLGLGDGPHRVTAAHPDWAEGSLSDVSPTESPVEIQVSAGGSLSGVVLSSEGVPVPNAEITTSTCVSELAAADARGHFRFPHLPAGSPSLTVAAAGFPPHQTVGPAIREGEDVRGYEIILPEGSRARGRVIDDSEQPIAAAEVHVLSLDDPACGHQRIMTEVDGTFEVSSLRAGALYQWRFWHPDFVALQGEPFEITTPWVEIGPWVELGDIVLSRGATISGRVIDSAGAALSHAAISLVPDAAASGIHLPNRSQTSTITDLEGRFVLTAVPDGVFRVRAKVRGVAPLFGDALTVGGGEFIRGVELQVPAGSIRGVLVDEDGAPLVGARVVITRREPALWASTLSRRDGSFQVAGIGSAIVEVEASYAGLSTTRVGSVEPDGEPLTLVLFPQAHFNGVVRAAATGLPVSGFRVRMEPSTNPADVGGPLQWLIGPKGGHQQHFHNADGKFEIPDVSVGTYHITVAAENYRPKIIEGVRVEPGSNPILEFLLDPGIRVRGRVVDAGGAPVEGAKITVAPIAREPVTRELGGDKEVIATGTRVRVNVGGLTRQAAQRIVTTDLGVLDGSAVSATTTTDGRFELRVDSSTSPRLRIAHPDFIDRFFDLAPAGGGALDLGDLVLGPGARLSGTVYASSGEPWRQGAVFLRHRENGFGSGATVGSDGRFEQRGLQPGVYDVFITRSESGSFFFAFGTDAEPVSTVELVFEEHHDIEIRERDED